MRTIVDYPVPVFAAVHGPTAGLGVPLALASGLVLAAESGYFLLAFTKAGLMPDGGATFVGVCLSSGDSVALQAPTECWTIIRQVSASGFRLSVRRS
ncbi:hypothetical protein DBV08_17975 [Rhodococcus sp. KBW08]|uniref:enoyl-CoA hydratase-related protein n=1 Tax=Rhodococcus sp. KBW08 TaxID=2144188 RepID=UPI000F5B1B97|nr:hypothetical protein DBV08_17975 [Rhodococcus sp. KBW08]